MLEKSGVVISILSKIRLKFKETTDRLLDLRVCALTRLAAYIAECGRNEPLHQAQPQGGV